MFASLCVCVILCFFACLLGWMIAFACLVDLLCGYMCVGLCGSLCIVCVDCVFVGLFLFFVGLLVVLFLV